MPRRRAEGNPSRRSSGALVPLDSLYGERSGAGVDFIHIEPLRDRSEVFDWSIDAHTHSGLHQVVLLFAGRVQVALDEITRNIAAPAVIAIPASVVHSFEFEPDSSGFMLSLADRQLDDSTVGTWLRSRLFESGATVELDENDTLVVRLQLLADELMSEQTAVETGHLATIGWLARTVLVLLARESERLHQSRPGHQASDLFRDFRSAVEVHYADHWTVKDYAEHLHTSESSLNRLCLTVGGTTAFEMVQSRLDVEARRRLTYSTVPIHRMAGDLGFSDPSYFARFFRRRTGLSPREFRDKYQSTMIPSG